MSGEGSWLDFFVVIFVFAIILLKLVIFIWYNSSRYKNKTK